MIEKFNFYDVYGYLIPGLVLVGLFWVPFVLLHRWPPGDLGSAILTLVFAYILGHVIQITVKGVIPPKIKDPFGEVRFPSDILLDTESLFSPKLKGKIAEGCRGLFEIDISAEKDPGNTPDTKEMERISGRRREAFFRARAMLVDAGNKGYAEQFEGLYAMTAGIVVGLGVAGCYFVGWAAAFWRYDYFMEHFDWLIGAGIILMVPAVILVIQSRSSETKKDRAKSSDDRKEAEKKWKAREKALACALALVSLCGGVVVGCRTLASTRSDAAHNGAAGIMILLTMGTAIVAVRLYGSYRAFAKYYAVTVWRDFAGMAKNPPTPTASNLPAPTPTTSSTK